MTPKMIALRNTLGIVVAGLAGGVIMSLAIVNLSFAQIITGFAILVILGVGNLVYQLELAKAESLDRLNKLKD